MTERIVIMLPLAASTASKLMLAIGDAFPGASVAEPTDEDKTPGDVLVIEVDG